ncbi:Solute carrier family 22 member 3 [Armadillidium nasatum]|uniref:Solute carrier family 22 member 3 n=1 Tax=Armadillidium nasatum TaxID=96803 RepID=A0A5N5SIV7_9CRUS|nr:Solute carrier family 22 member 3 [Armadillidium nasatum]
MSKSLSTNGSVSEPLRSSEDENEDPSESSASEAFRKILMSVGEAGKYQWKAFLIASFCGMCFSPLIVLLLWDLVCDRRWMMTSAQATYMGGVLVGAVILSELSDLYGRRTIVLISSVGFTVCGICISFSRNFFMFITLRFLVACFGSGMFLPNFVLIMELVGEKARTTMGMLYQGFFGVGFCLIPAIAYYIRDWRNLQLAISIPSTVLLLYFKILPESPRWLLSQGREEEAVKILKEIAKTNNQNLPEEKELHQLMSRIRKAKLLKTPNMRRRCLIIYFSWFVVSMIYYGLTFSGGNINASVYLMVFLSGVVEIPSYFLSCLTIKKFGRRINISFCFIICGIACMLILAVPKDMVWLNMTFASAGKFFNSIAFGVAYIYSAELVPTTVRNIAVGTSSMWARVGSMLAPFIVDSLGEVHYAIPSTVFGILSLMAGFLDLLLPETGKIPMPETIEEVEAMDR